MSASVTSASRVWKHVGVLGGGQLGRMMTEAANRLGVQVTVLDPSDPCPSGLVGAGHVVGSMRDAAKIEELVQRGVDVVTFEIEHIDADAVATAATDLPVHPSVETLKVVQDKYAQKVHMSHAGIPMAPFASVDTMEGVLEFGTTHGYPFMLKARRLAYDGRGNAVVSSAEAASDAVSSLGGLEHGLYCESWVKYSKELAVMVVRSRDGDVRSYPCVETEQEDSICRRVVAPARIPAAVRLEACRLAEVAVGALSGAGVFGVELFYVPDGKDGVTVLYNEVAPRPHNSGHYTIEACECDQFENHLRAVLGLPLGSTAMRVGGAVMINALGRATGDEGAPVEKTWASPCGTAFDVPAAGVHWYGKKGVRPGRKVGHVTVTAPTLAQALARADRLESPTSAIEGEGGSGEAGGDGDDGRERGDGSDGKLPVVGVIMGSDSDLPTMKACCQVLEEFDVAFEVAIVSAHRTPERMISYAKSARERGVQVIIAAAGGAAHLPGMVAAATPLPVIGVPVPLSHLDGVDSLHSIVQMPRGVPVATVAIGNSTNAALLAIRILSTANPALADAMEAYQLRMQDTVLAKDEALQKVGWKAYEKK